MKAEQKMALYATLVCAVAATAYAQVATPPGTGSLDAVAREIRLLRQTLEKQNASNTRAQLLVGRLALQDQRTARARQSVQRLEGDLVTAERERDQLQAVLRQAARGLERAPEQEHSQLEAQVRMLREQAAQAHERISKIEGRLAEARQTLDCDEIDRWLAALDRQVQEVQ
jgi:predicted  nucleic acid-binding Zn-ribbon protein